MSVMVERVTQAIADHFEGGAAYFSDLEDDLSLASVNGVEMDIPALARAMLAAMREPTEAMLIAARDWSQAKYGKPIGNDAAIGCWQAMHEAALS